MKEAETSWAGGALSAGVHLDACERESGRAQGERVADRPTAAWSWGGGLLLHQVGGNAPFVFRTSLPPPLLVLSPDSALLGQVFSASALFLTRHDLPVTLVSLHTTQSLLQRNTF